MKLDTITLQRVEFMPKQLEPGILYVSEKYGTAAHLCACGCGAKIRTPLGPTEWAVRETLGGPSLWPSIGNWQQTCRSHYIIRGGRIVWAGDWTELEIKGGRLAEALRRKAYFDAMYADQRWTKRFWRWLKGLLGL
jgi:hypothetical protein